MLDEDAEQVLTPIGQPCSGCDEKIVAGDRGVMSTFIDLKAASVLPVHMECDMLPILGHIFKVCSCHKFGNSRADALVLLERINAARRQQGLGDL